MFKDRMTAWNLYLAVHLQLFLPVIFFFPPYTQVAMVGDIGGTSLDDATRRMMPYLLSNDLAVQFNLHGRHSKRKFREMRLYDVIYGKFEC